MASHVGSYAPLDVVKYKIKNDTGVLYLQKGTNKIQEIYLDKLIRLENRPCDFSKNTDSHELFKLPIGIYTGTKRKRPLTIRQLLRNNGKMLKHFIRTNAGNDTSD